MSPPASRAACSRARGRSGTRSTRNCLRGREDRRGRRAASAWRLFYIRVNVTDSPPARRSIRADPACAPGLALRPERAGHGGAFDAAFILSAIDGEYNLLRFHAAVRQLVRLDADGERAAQPLEI